MPAGEEMKQRVCMEYGHSYPPSSCLPVFNTDGARAGCNDSLLGDTCAPEYLEKDQLLATGPKSFGVSSLLFKSDSLCKLFDLISTQVQGGHHSNCLLGNFKNPRKSSRRNQVH